MRGKFYRVTRSENEAGHPPRNHCAHQVFDYPILGAEDNVNGEVHTKGVDLKPPDDYQGLTRTQRRRTDQTPTTLRQCSGPTSMVCYHETRVAINDPGCHVQ